MYEYSEDKLATQAQTVEERLKVYKKALELLENQKTDTVELFGLHPSDEGLCLLLPCIRWDLSHFLQNLPDGSCYRYEDTPRIYIELAPHIDYIGEAQTPEERTDRRIEVLKQMIAELES